MSWTLDDWYNAAQVASVVLIGVTFLVAGGTFFAGKKVNERNNEQIATLDKQRAEAELKLEALRKESAWRSISPEKRQNFLDAVTNDAKGRIRMTVSFGDAEAAMFAGELRSMLRAAGWEPLPVGIPVEAGGPIWLGVHVIVPNLRELEREDFHVARLVTELGSIVEVRVSEDSGLNDAEAIVRVGHKPRPQN